MKNDLDLFTRLYISFQKRDGNLDEFFSYDKSSKSLALSHRDTLYLGSKGALLVCLEGVDEAQSDALTVTSMVFDG